MSRVHADVLLVGMIVFALALLSPPVPADEIPSTALLQVGPQQRRGIDLLAPDLTPHWYGRYRVGEALVDVYYLSSPLDQPAGWDAAPCPLRDLRARDASLVYYEHEAGWSLFVHRVAGDLTPAVTVCEFTDRFIDQHLLFEDLALVSVPGDAPVFPAVIEL